MISIALRNLFAEKTRFAISVGGVAFSVMLMLIILSLYQGWRLKATEYIHNVDTDLWVTQTGSADITNSASILRADVGEKLKEIDGVDKISRFIGKPVDFQLKGKEVNQFLVGFDPSDPVNGPQRMLKGTSNIKDNEIVIDRVLAQGHNLEIDDVIDVLGKPFKIVGISEGANMFLFQFSFITQKEAQDLLKINDFTNFYLVKVQSGRLDEVKNKINKIDGVQALTRDEFVQKNRRLIEDVFLPIIFVLVSISILVGTAVIGLTIYTSTIEKSREFGVIKALGASNSQIYRIIFEQSLFSGIIGYFLGVGLTYFALWLIPHFVSVFVTETRPIDLLMILVISMFMSFFASYTPVRRIVKIDPALVFKS